nr:gamma tubulin complex component 4 [Hymenolepis microstoma]
MLHELLFSLLGYSGDICTVVRECNSSSDPKCRVKLISEKLPFITPSEIQLITQILEIAGSYVRLKDFIKKFTLPGSGSVYLSNLAFAMDEVLTQYRDMIASVEADLLKTPSLGVTYILSKVEPYRSVLHNLCKILECSVKQFQQNKCIIDSLVSIERSPAVNVIWHYLLRVFRSQLSEWLIFGTVNDPYGEFFITSDGEFIADKYPTILPPSLVNDILFAGKAVQRSDENLSQKLEERFFERFEEIADTDLLGGSDAEAENLVHEIWEFISAERWRHMSEDFGLLEHLNLVRDVLLLGRGELFGSFFENLLVGGRYILDSPISSSATEVRNLCHAVNVAFLSAARSVGFDEECLTQRFKLTVLMNPTKEIETALCSLVNSSKCQSNAIQMPTFTSWDCLRIDFTSVPIGLESVFTESARISYGRLFTFLLTICRTQHLLKNTWRIHKHNVPSQHHFQRMMFLVDHLLSYLQVDVISVAFSKLMKTFEGVQSEEYSCRDLGNVEAFHEKFLADLESQSFLHYDQIYSLILQLLNECRKYCNSCTIQAKSAEIMTSFDHLAYNLFAALSAASAMMTFGGTHLSQLILRLNFNNFFSGLSNYQAVL